MWHDRRHVHRGRIAMEAPVKLFWQPGCSSCLRTKEFLLRRGVPFQSVNVHGDEAAWEELRRLGPRSVPVVSRGDRFVFGQVLDDVATFLGLEVEQRRLPPAALVDRIDRVLGVAVGHVRRLPPESLGTKLPNRNRSYRELAYHVFRIPDAFLEAAVGAPFRAESVNALPPDELRSAEELAGYGETVRAAVRRWWTDEGEAAAEREMDTYFGRRKLHVVLERTAWHSAQHTRQLEMVLGMLGRRPDPALAPADIAGLPLPENVWDAAQA
jgi:glutaredoxin